MKIPAVTTCNSHVRRVGLLLALATTAAGGGGCLDGAATDDEVSMTSNELVLTRSFGPTPGGNPTSYARVKDRLRFVPQRVEVVNWDHLFDGSLLIVAIVTLPDGTTQRIDNTTESFHIGDTLTWPADPNTAMVFDVERIPGQCFKVEMHARGWPPPEFVTRFRAFKLRADYCWSEQTQNWSYVNLNRDEVHNCAPANETIQRTRSIDTDDTQYASCNSDFAVNVFWRVNWIATAVNGLLGGRTTDQADGPEWHHLPAIPWESLRLHRGRLAPITGDPDLYVSGTSQPSYAPGTWGCRPYLGSMLDETCGVVAENKPFFSIRNYLGTPTAYDFVDSLDQGGWTPWLDSDDPSGNGDGEHLSAFVQSGKACAKPMVVQCRVVGTHVPWMQTGENYSCTTTAGGVCLNANQPDNQCEDYEVRFFCPG